MNTVNVQLKHLPYNSIWIISWTTKTLCREMINWMYWSNTLYRMKSDSCWNHENWWMSIVTKTATPSGFSSLFGNLSKKINSFFAYKMQWILRGNTIRIIWIKHGHESGWPFHINSSAFLLYTQTELKWQPVGTISLYQSYICSLHITMNVVQLSKRWFFTKFNYYIDSPWPTKYGKFARKKNKRII